VKRIPSASVNEEANNAETCDATASPGRVTCHFRSIVGVLQVTFVPAAAVAAGALLGYGGYGPAVSIAFLATMLAVILGICAVLTDRPKGASPSEQWGCSITIGGIILLAPVLFDHYRWDAFWGVPWVIPILCWLTHLVRKRAWLCVAVVWLVLFAATIAIINNARDGGNVIGLWLNWMRLF
jgi:hypothetical protein